MSDDEIPRGDLVKAMVELAANDERLCRIALAADTLAAFGEALVIFGYKSKHARERFERALQDFKIVRQGQ